jgi:hypothetical protein
VTSLTGSGIGRALACPPAFALPAIHQDNDHAARGREVHAFLEQLSKGTPRSEALAAVPVDLRPVCESINPARVPLGDVEVAYAYHVRTGQARRLEVAGRAYDPGPEEVPGRVDLVHQLDDGTFEVLDWKTTRWTFDPVAARPQLNFYALCVARERGLKLIRCAIVVITDDGQLAWHHWSLSRDELGKVSRDVRSAWERVGAARAARREHERTAVAPWTPDVTQGAWCRYCPAQASCPGMRAQVAAITGGQFELVTPEIAGQAYQAAQIAEQAADRVRKAVGVIHDSTGPIPLGDGRWVRRDGRRALRVFGGRSAA